MGAVKDLVDLVTQLSSSVENRKFAAELREIQSMIGGILSEHAALHEQRIKLMTENAELKQTNADLQQFAAALQQKITDLKNSHSQPSKTLSDNEVAILCILAKMNEVPASQISHVVHLDLTKTEYWLEELKKKDMIMGIYFGDSPTLYKIIQNGREFLIKNNLI